MHPFQSWLKENIFKQNSGSYSSYYRAFQILSQLLKKENYISRDLLDVNDPVIILELYNFVIKEQKKEASFLYYPSNPSYFKNKFYSASLKKYLFYLESKSINYGKYNNLFKFNNSISSIGLFYNSVLCNRFISSLLTKPFVILTGLSGSGKTKLAQAFAMWMSEVKEQYAIIPVGADWTNREPLLGYPNSLKSQHYVKPDSGVLDILLRAHENYIENNKDVSLCKPYFLILDEMNLSHVERYFADFLSAMESGDEIKLYSGSERYDELDASGVPIPGKNPIPNSLVLPKNLFIIGTVNIDETTYMFSPKVLDRANTIEFRISSEEMAAYLDNHKPLDMEQLLEDVDNNKGKGAIQTEPFMALATRKDLIIDRKKHQETFVSFFKQLQRAGTEFGYRTANEMTELVSFLNHFSVPPDEAYDIAIMQKLLPKLNGSRSKLSKVLSNLGALCLNSGNKEEAEQLFNEYKVDQDVLNRRSTDIKFKLSFEKLCRMNKNAQDNGFASYAEA
jgi:energy-coupling factor transporter ATP-binding protein EcfA2